jgi:hypothetical protein
MFTYFCSGSIFFAQTGAHLGALAVCIFLKIFSFGGISFQLIATLALEKFIFSSRRLSHFQVKRAVCAAARSNTICRSLKPLRLVHASPSAHNFVDHLIFGFHLFDCCGAYRDDLARLLAYTY